MKKRIVDVSERTLATFAQAFLAVVLATNVTDLTALKAGAIAGGIAIAKYGFILANTYLAKDQS